VIRAVDAPSTVARLSYRQAEGLSTILVLVLRLRYRLLVSASLVDHGPDVFRHEQQTSFVDGVDPKDGEEGFAAFEALKESQCAVSRPESRRMERLVPYQS
jgi:hypothetical protein